MFNTNFSSISTITWRVNTILLEEKIINWTKGKIVLYFISTVCLISS